MKLTRKGLLKIVGDIVVDSPEYLLSKTLDNWNRTRDFDQDDFEGVVCLTVEEACEILDYLGYLHLSGGRDSFLKDLEKCNRNLYERIEQAEGK